MVTKVHFQRVSSNVKTGPIPATMSQKDTCPINCSLKGSGCYAESGNVNIHWQRLSDGRYDGNDKVTDWGGLCVNVKSLPKGQIWRHNSAGDLPHTKQWISAPDVLSLADANTGRRGFTYTHHIVNGQTTAAKHNRSVIKQSNGLGFTINLSADNLTMADAYVALGIAPVVVILPEDSPTIQQTPGGHTVVVCPAITSDKVTCSTCGICAKSDRKSIIGFPVHGTGKKKAGKVFMMKADTSIKG